MKDTSREEYNAIDLAKFFCALLVLSIHFAPFGNQNTNPVFSLLNYGIRNWLARMAVPFFFTASGFFLFRKTSYEDFSLAPTGRYLAKIFKLYVIWTILCLPLCIKDIIYYDGGIFQGIVLYCRNCIFAGSFNQLWFFPALIFAVALVSFMISKKVPIKNILAIAGLFYTAGLLAESWFGIIRPLKFSVPALWNILKLIQAVIFSTRDGLFEGFLFVGIGASIAFNGFAIPKKRAAAGLVFSSGLMLIEAAAVEYFDFARAYDTYIFLVPATFFAFGLLTDCRMPGNAELFKTLRAMSSLIFYGQFWVKTFIAKLFILIGIKIETTCFLYLLVAAGSILFSYFIIRLSSIRQFRWLKKIYS